MTFGNIFNASSEFSVMIDDFYMLIAFALDVLLYHVLKVRVFLNSEKSSVHCTCTWPDTLRLYRIIKIFLLREIMCD